MSAKNRVVLGSFEKARGAIVGKSAVERKWVGGCGQIDCAIPKAVGSILADVSGAALGCGGAWYCHKRSAVRTPTGNT